MLKRLRLGFLLGLAILIIDATVPLLVAQREAQIRAAADSASTTYDHLQQLLSAYKDTETGQRGFMLTGKREFLEPYTSGRANIAALLPQLQTELADTPQQMRHFQQLLELDRQEYEFQRNRIEQRSQDNRIDIEASEYGKQLMDKVRIAIAELGAVERKNVDDLLQQVRRIEHWSHISIVMITALDLVLFVALFIVALRSMQAQKAASATLSDLNNNLSNEIALRNEALQQLERQTNRLNEIVRLQTTLSESQLGISQFMEQIVQRMLELTEASGAVIEMIDGDDMIYTAASGTLTRFIGLRLKRKGSLSGLCVEKAALLIAADTRTDPRVDRAACEKVGAGSMIVAPLTRVNETVGVLKLIGTQPNAFPTNAAQTLQLMAGFLGAALGNQVQYKKNQALLAERGITLSTLKRELQRREEYEEKLLKQRERTETILEFSHEAFICIGADGRVKEWNALSATTFGWKKEEAFGQLLEDLIIPERFRAAHRGGIAHFLKTGEGPMLNRRIELPALCRDGREIPIELTISAIKDGDNAEFTCFLRDITERKHAEVALLNQQATLHALTNAIPALVSLIDAQGRYAYCNDEYETMFGVAVQNIIGKSVREFLGEQSYNDCKDHIDKALAGESVVYERTIDTAIGTRHQECRHIPQFNTDGEPDGFYLIAWDITERKTQEIEWQSRASIDELTGLSNRAFFIEELNLALSRHQRSDLAIAMLYLDVDRFKHINDTYGHAAGDALLKAFAGYLKLSVRQSDILGRFGGDEFCIALDNIKTPINAIAVAEKILENARTPIVFEQHVLTISTSIGITFVQQPQMTSAALIALADAALYKAKQAGRNRYALDIIPAASAGQRSSLL